MSPAIICLLLVISHVCFLCGRLWQSTMFHVFWEKLIGWQEEKTTEEEKEAEVSMSHCILRLLTSLIHYCSRSFIMDEQVQCHTPRNRRSQYHPFPLIAPQILPQPSHKPPTPPSFFIVSLDCDLHRNMDRDGDNETVTEKKKRIEKTAIQQCAQYKNKSSHVILTRYKYICWLNFKTS